MQTVNEVIEQYLALLTKNSDSVYTFTLEAGKKYIKVVQERHSFGGGRSVHSFVDKNTGDLYKAASWKAPAKIVRYNLFTDMEKLSTVADPYGSYLYL